MSTLNTYYVLGSSVNATDVSYIQNQNTILKTDPTLYFGCDYGLEELEKLLHTLHNNMTTGTQQIFLVGSASFPLDFLQFEESFLRRYPICASFFKYAKDGNERDAYSMHKIHQNIHLYIINLYTVHETNLILQL
jgi:hypothetical protein